MLDPVPHRHLGDNLPWFHVVHKFVVRMFRCKCLCSRIEVGRELEVLRIVHGVHGGRQTVHVGVQAGATGSPLTQRTVLTPPGQRADGHLLRAPRHGVPKRVQHVGVHDSVAQRPLDEARLPGVVCMRPL